MARVPLLFALVLTMMLSVSSSARADDPVAPPESHAVAPSTDGHLLLWPATIPETAIAHPILRRGHDMGLITAGIVWLTLGTLVGVFIASTDLAFGNCMVASTRMPCGTAGFSLIPIVGSALAGSVDLVPPGPPVSTVVLGIVGVVPQVIGLILVWMGMYGFTEDLVPEAAIGDAVVRIAPILSGSEIGGALSVTL